MAQERLQLFTPAALWRVQLVRWHRGPIHLDMYACGTLPIALCSPWLPRRREAVAFPRRWHLRRKFDARCD